MVYKSEINTENRLSDPDGQGEHKHCAGPVAFAHIEYNLMVESGKDEPPPFTELVRKTHMRKDGTYVDHRAKSIVEEVELNVSQISAANESQTGSSAAIPSRTHLLNQTFLQINKPKKGHIYGLGNAQYKEVQPNETAHASLTRNLDTEMRLTSLETDVKAIRECEAAMRDSQHVILRGFGIDPVTHQPIRPSTTPTTGNVSGAAPTTIPGTSGMQGVSRPHREDNVDDWSD